MTQERADRIVIEHVDDFKILVDQKLSTVVDPMVFRAGEIFLRGLAALNRGDDQSSLTRDGAWEFLERNIPALGFFIDAAILNERLPLFNYAETFEHDKNFDARSFAAINEEAKESVLMPVDVSFGIYLDIKKTVIKQLEQRLDQGGPAGGKWVDPDLAKSIVSELSQSDYRWDLSLGAVIEDALPTHQDRQIGRFLLGGMIFSQYADYMQSEHWLQPKRSKLFAQAMTGATHIEDEQQLFEWLSQQFKLPFCKTMQPTFLHLVLSKAKKRSDIPKIIARLRESGAVKDYRGWRAQALEEWRTRGGISEHSVKTIKDLKGALTDKGINADEVREAGIAWVETAAAAAAASGEPTATMVAGVATAALKTTAPAYGFIKSILPGHRHVKLMADSIHLRELYPRIERSVKTLWEHD